ncbi:MAG: hypothetical protein M1822_009733 [Bathelium mastoideum]|nr:MAG: hypothetical protein M1822_009733 [Bathelium mastoideum]
MIAPSKVLDGAVRAIAARARVYLKALYKTKADIEEPNIDEAILPSPLGSHPPDGPAFGSPDWWEANKNKANPGFAKPTMVSPKEKPELPTRETADEKAPLGESSNGKSLADKDADVDDEEERVMHLRKWWAQEPEPENLGRRPDGFF